MLTLLRQKDFNYGFILPLGGFTYTGRFSYCGGEFVLAPEFGRSGQWRLTNSPYSKIFTKSHSVYIDFDKSWEWLMPVVEKIMSIDEVVEFKIGSVVTEIYCRINNNVLIPSAFLDGNMMQRTYKAVVAFIEWHISADKKE